VWARPFATVGGRERVVELCELSKVSRFSCPPIPPGHVQPPVPGPGLEHLVHREAFGIMAERGRLEEWGGLPGKRRVEELDYEGSVL